MNRKEFEKMTGFYPSIGLYAEIENEYMKANICKDDFCKDYKKMQMALQDVCNFPSILNI